MPHVGSVLEEGEGYNGSLITTRVLRARRRRHLRCACHDSATRGARHLHSSPTMAWRQLYSPNLLAWHGVPQTVPATGRIGLPGRRRRVGRERRAQNLRPYQHTSAWEEAGRREAAGGLRAGLPASAPVPGSSRRCMANHIHTCRTSLTTACLLAVAAHIMSAVAHMLLSARHGMAKTVAKNRKRTIWHRG